MSIIERILLGVCLAAISIAEPAHSQEWNPSQAVELIVGSAPGGGNDRIARAVQKILQDRKIVGVPVTVVDKGGGGGSIAFTYLNQHGGDAHYIVLGNQ